jgi:hypothetical protein
MLPLPKHLDAWMPDQSDVIEKYKFYLCNLVAPHTFKVALPRRSGKSTLCAYIAQYQSYSHKHIAICGPSSNNQIRDCLSEYGDALEKVNDTLFVNTKSGAWIQIITSETVVFPTELDVLVVDDVNWCSPHNITIKTHTVHLYSPAPDE